MALHFLKKTVKKIRDRVEIAEIFNNYFSNLAKSLTSDVNTEFDPTDSNKSFAAL
jgi:hypothetical protein